MELQTIQQVSKAYDISSRMLRYYEQTGLIESFRNEDNAYRLYDESTLKRIQQIIILRKLRLPVKHIKAIFENQDATAAIEAFQKNISELDEEITALSTIKSILKHLVNELKDKANIIIQLDALTDSSILPMIDSLSFTDNKIKENLSIDALNRASEVINKLRNVRVVYLPPMTVASVLITVDAADNNMWLVINDFVKKNDLYKIKPDLRVFRLYHMSSRNSNEYELWVSIPDDLIISAPFIKKKFCGGHYAAHSEGDGGYEIFLGLLDWINSSENYQYDYDGNLLRCDPPINENADFGGMSLDLAECLNYYDIYHGFDVESEFDILLPVIRHKILCDTPVEIPDSKEKCGFKAWVMTRNKFRIIGFTRVLTPESGNPNKFEDELIKDDRLDILNKYKAKGAPILGFGSIDMDARLRGGWRWTICLAESDITDVQALMKHNLFVKTIDASRWLIIEHEKGEPFDDHSICMKLGYTWNRAVAGSIYVRPDGKIGKPDPNDETDMKSTVYCWYPVKYDKETKL